MVDIPRSLPATVTNTSETFRDCSSLVGSNLSGWDTSRVTSMSGMFVNCQLMNADLSQWGVALVTSMSNMFYNCSSFASNLAFWSVDAVESMSNMFYNANSYTSNMSGWTLSGLVFNSGVDNFMSSAAGLSTSDYDATLIGWDVKKASLLNNLRPNFGGSKYTEGSPAATARAALVAYGWTITDGGTA